MPSTMDAQLRITQVNLPPDMIDLGIGQPGLDLLPLEMLRHAADHALSQGVPDMLNYGREQGDGYFLRALASFLTPHYACSVVASQLFATAGASQALDLICTLYAQPGDTIFVEEPSYFLALRIFADHQLNVVGIPIDDQGLRMDALDEALAQHRPAFLYTIPTYQNPTGVTLAHERRDQVLERSRSQGFLIVADEVYHLLNYTDVPPPPFAAAIDAGNVLSIGSFSKILAPGLRLAWIQAGPRQIEQLAGCGLVDSGGGLNPFTSAIVRSILELGLLDVHLGRLKSVYAQRVRRLDEALQRELGAQVIYRRPDGGFFFWIQLAAGQNAAALLRAVQAENAGYQPGIRFSSRGALQEWLRLSFAYFDQPQLSEGIRRMAAGMRLAQR